MRARKLLLIGVVAVVGVIAARALGLWTANQFGSTPNSSQTTTPVLVFAEEDLTFGPIPESESVERELRITNTSTQPLTISRFERTCTCLDIEPDSDITLQPGDTKELRLKVRGTLPDRGGIGDCGLHNERVGLAAIQIESDGREYRTPIVINYSVQATARFEPAELRVGVVSHREPLTITSIITLYPPATDLQVAPNPNWDVTMFGDHNRRQLVAVAKRPDTPRVLDDTLEVIPVTVNGSERPRRRLRVHGEIALDVAAVPARVPLGRVAQGRSVEEHFRLGSLTGRKFDVIAVGSESEDVVVERASSDPSLYTVRIRVTDIGEQERLVAVRVKQDDGSELKILVPIQYHGEEGVR